MCNIFLKYWKGFFSNTRSFEGAAKGGKFRQAKISLKASGSEMDFQTVKNCPVAPSCLASPCKISPVHIPWLLFLIIIVADNNVIIIIIIIIIIVNAIIIIGITIIIVITIS